ncbi:hypothetical protein TeGR_g9312 [Tetraparma gracilis]|uniref:Uncharacterized protein n=1 Tax=Tetraparma gracilis TaxID=2962635 RepID=A0ABQ6MEY4_9STRA|nr:hypothetical protein TeGR_g9312 [Tetraparma gracilis]
MTPIVITADVFPTLSEFTSVSRFRVPPELAELAHLLLAAVLSRSGAIDVYPNGHSPAVLDGFANLFSASPPVQDLFEDFIMPGFGTFSDPPPSPPSPLSSPTSPSPPTPPTSPLSPPSRPARYFEPHRPLAKDTKDSNPYTRICSVVTTFLAEYFQTSKAGFLDVNDNFIFWLCGELVSVLHHSLVVFSDHDVYCDLSLSIAPLLDKLLRSRQDGGFGSHHGTTVDYIQKNQRFFDALRGVLGCKELRCLFSPDLIAQYSLSSEAERFLVGQLHLPVSVCACLEHGVGGRKRSEEEEETVTRRLLAVYALWQGWSGKSGNGNNKVLSPFKLEDQGGRPHSFTTVIDNLSRFLEDSVLFVTTGVATMKRYTKPPAGRLGKRVNGGKGEPVELIFIPGKHSNKDVAELVDVHLRMVHILHFRWHSYLENALDRQRGASHETLMHKLAAGPWGWNGDVGELRKNVPREKKK